MAYVLKFSANPFAPADTAAAIQTARIKLDRLFGGSDKVEAAKRAFDDVGGVIAWATDFDTPAIMRWRQAITSAFFAAWDKHQPAAGLTSVGPEMLSGTLIDMTLGVRPMHTNRAAWTNAFTMQMSKLDAALEFDDIAAIAEELWPFKRGLDPIAVANEEWRKYRLDIAALRPW